MFQTETGRHWGILGALLTLSLSLYSTPSWAFSNQPGSEVDSLEQALTVEDKDQLEHYMISDPVDEIRIARFLSPAELLEVRFEDFKKTVLKAIQLTSWVKMSGPLEPAPERYNRRRQFGTWKRDPSTGSCLDTRATVLARSSLIPVTTRPTSNGRCVVVSGRWIDPYINREFTVGSEVSIDHMVPLKNAYLAGGWRWNNQKRCQYFNFTDSPDHLLAVSGPENSSKGDSSPADYMPPVRSYQCQYLKSWLSVKAVWSLALSGEEAGAIREEIKQLGCNESDLKLSSTEVARLRTRINNGTPACPPPRDSAMADIDTDPGIF